MAKVIDEASQRGAHRHLLLADTADLGKFLGGKADEHCNAAALCAVEDAFTIRIAWHRLMAIADDHSMLWYVSRYSSRMDPRLERLLDLLDGSDVDTVGTSVRLPGNLRDAAVLAAELGLVASTTELTVRGLRDALAAFAQRAVLDAHYRSHPDARPDLAEIALAAAEIDGNPLAARPDLLRRAAAGVGLVKDDPGPDDVLLYAAGLAAAVA